MPTLNMNQQSRADQKETTWYVISSLNANQRSLRRQTLALTYIGSQCPFQTLTKTLQQIGGRVTLPTNNRLAGQCPHQPLAHTTH